VQLTFIKIEAVGHHVAGKINVRETVIIEIGNGNTAAVVDVFEIKDVQAIVIRNNIIEMDTGMV